jgi:hypothetical protein
MADSWNSVQIVTVIVAALTPVTVLVLGVIFARASRKIEQVQWANQTVVTHRLDVYDKLAPGLNRLLCFATFVGGWKEIEPRQAIAIKRELDETMYAYKVLFSDELFAAYHRFMTVLFDMFGTTGADAKVRAPIESKWGSRRDQSSWWNDALSALFTDDPAGLDEIQAAYDGLSRQFRADLYVTRQARPLLTTRSS